MYNRLCIKAKLLK